MIRTARPASRAARPASWVRTRLGAMPSAAVLAAVLAFAAVFLSAALPRALDRGADQALRSYVGGKGPGPTSVLVTGDSREGPGAVGDLDRILGVLTARTGGAFPLAPSGPVHGTLGGKPRVLSNPGLSRPDDESPRLSLLHLREAAGHLTMVAGRWPSGTTAEGQPIPVALSKRASEAMAAPLGTVLQTDPDGPQAPVVDRAVVVGLYVANDEADPVWTGLPCLSRACTGNTGGKEPRTYWHAGALAGADDLPRVAAWGKGGTEFWRLPMDTSRLRADQLADTGRQISAFVSGPTAAALIGDAGRQDLTITSALPALLADAQARQQAAAPVGVSGPAGVAGVVFVVLCLSAALAGERRESELRLLFARGASRVGLVRRLLAEGAVTVLPAAVLAAALALVLLPTPRFLPALSIALATTLLAWLAFPVRALVLLAPPRPRNRWRRPVAELLVLLVTAAAVFEVRDRGIAQAGADVDPLLVAAPLLIALSGALLLARIQPLLVALPARMAARGSGVIGFLGLARAGRGNGGRGRTAVLPLVALLLAVTTGGFWTTVLNAAEAARLAATRVSVAADAEIVAPPDKTLPDALVKAAGKVEGVRSSISLWTDDDAFVDAPAANFTTQVTVVVVEPKAYAELSKAVGIGPFDPALLGGKGTGTPESPLPVLFSSGLAKLAPGGTVRLRFGDGHLQVASRGVVEGTPVRPGAVGATVIVPAGPATAAIPLTRQPNRWYAVGTPPEDQLKVLVRSHVPAGEASVYRVRTSAGMADELASDPLQHAAVRLFVASVAGAAGFALLAVLLSLVRAAPERAALLARMRTMGLRPRQGVLLMLTESLPQALVAALGGALTATAAVLLLGPAVDLSTLVGAPVEGGLPFSARPVLMQALGLAALVGVAVVAEAAVSGRRQITTELRAGDQR
ncbi:hypothetical protein ABT084_20065 [Streptomyces sp. NPDC002138]|uniref:hypothetical protein n=1 Tax=Streptomyces sp. NPDC002138 TaxID=3154410 RepID=UPI00332A975C